MVLRKSSIRSCSVRGSHRRGGGPRPGDGFADRRPRLRLRSLSPRQVVIAHVVGLGGEAIQALDPEPGHARHPTDAEIRGQDPRSERRCVVNCKRYCTSSNPSIRWLYPSIRWVHPSIRWVHPSIRWVDPSHPMGSSIDPMGRLIGSMTSPIDPMGPSVGRGVALRGCQKFCVSGDSVG